MLRDGTVERLAGDICRMLSSNFAELFEGRGLEKDVELAVWRCMMDSPHCGQLDEDPRDRLAGRICLELQSLLGVCGGRQDWQERLAKDLHEVVLAGLKRAGPVRRAV